MSKRYSRKAILFQTVRMKKAKMKEVIIKSIVRSACSGLPELGKPFEIKLSWDDDSSSEEGIEVVAELLNPLHGGSVAYASIRVMASDITTSLELSESSGWDRSKTLHTAQWVDQILSRVWQTRGNGDPAIVTIII